MPIVPGLMSFSYHLTWEHGHIGWMEELSRAIDLGLRSVEWCGPIFADPDSFDPGIIETLRREADRHGVRCQVAGWAPLLATGDEVRQVERHLTVQLESTRIFGAKVLRMGNMWDPQMRINVPRPLPVVLDNLKRITEAGARAGVTIAFEDHLDFRLPDFQFFLREINSPWFRVTLDTGNLLPVQEDAVAFCDALAGQIVNVHFKGVEYIWTDAGAVLTGTTPERSIVDLRAVLNRLRREAHEITLHIEGQCMREEQEAGMVAAYVDFLHGEGLQ
jgi:sugar phosphate isomerase/epimerase